MIVIADLPLAQRWTDPEPLIDVSQVLTNRLTQWYYPPWLRLTRDEALERLCGWANWQRNKEWGEQFQKARDAARAEFPVAIAEIGAAL